MHGDVGSAVEAFDEYVLVVRRNHSLLATAAIVAICCAVLASEAQTTVASVGAFLAWVAMGLLIHLWRRNPAADERSARVHADARGLRIDGRLLLEACRLRAAWLEPGRGGPTIVRLRARGLARGVTLAVHSRESGRAVLRALGVDPTRVTAHSWTMARPLAERRLFAPAVITAGLFLAFGFVAGQSTPVALALAVVALGVLVVAAAAPTRVTVGADGVLVAWLGTGRFVAWSSVSSIEATEHGLVLALESGEWLTLRTSAGPALQRTERDVLLERMNFAWRACAPERADDPAARLVERAGGDTREWVRSVRGISTAWNGYRTAAMPACRLWRVVEDPTADWTSRTGAALALGPSLDVDGRTRLRAAAASCAEPRVRLALKAAANASAGSEDDELAAALDTVDGEGGHRASADHRHEERRRERYIPPVHELKRGE